MALTIEDRMTLQLIDEGLRTASDEDALMMFGMVDGEELFTPTGTPTELCTEIAKKITKSRPHLQARVCNFVSAKGQSAP
ncbi:MAG: hypothetical protein A2845_03785 [Candidatus Lloydbacteria bacterium RIFCSPHIGHO2_01_FULL_49_22]|uniref:Uncharacterized protein n=1 Tax=Candidatus Lloydbacteria bacterium RIFCSPHIGHO2_01_FULL_49_22 TaxID=1798658 RepID=A0A1G2CX02_9BACT|nr:MAG: hypothetical protein A2845_03785 [Candidatus Lloydbacteria bacterium RIFCSPHIGHO2_01_FULL_49_22]OGZ09049.1 MAG: hypothetical protein A3C14_03620 [Candidatus Lloydbacteria bacterium RIFCSPHIGHO2_02_FULL_50_18]